MTLWEALWPRVQAKAQALRFGTLTVTVTMPIRDGVVQRVNATWDETDSIGPEDVKRMLDKSRELG